MNLELWQIMALDKQAIDKLDDLLSAATSNRG
jgi:hypothetical protein